MDYIKQSTLNNFEMLDEWYRGDRSVTGYAKYKRLVEAAREAASSRKHRYLTTDDEKEREMLDLFYCSLLDTPSFKDEPELPYFDWGEEHCFAIEAHYAEGYLEFCLSVGCGSFVTCRYVKKTKMRVYPFSQFTELVYGKRKVCKAHADRIREEIIRDTARKEELEKTLKGVNAATALMDIFGLKMDAKSVKKVAKWNTEFQELTRKLK